MNKKYRIYDIDWDTDGEEVNLPTELVVEIKNETDDIRETLSDYVTDTFGFCHNGFSFAEYTPNEVAQLAKVVEIINNDDDCAEEMVAKIGDLLGQPL